MDVVLQRDEAHFQAKTSMHDLMYTPDAIKSWFEDRKKAFKALVEE